MTLEQDVQRAREAQQLLDSALYADAYTQVEDAITERWKASRDAVEREQLHTMLGLLAKLRGVFEGAVRSGEVAAEKLQRKQTLRERLTR